MIWLGILAAVWSILASLGIVTLADHLRWAAAWRRLLLHAFTQHPTANLTPPTNLELHHPAWLEHDDDA